MMMQNEAIEKIRAIRNGRGINRDAYPEEMRGRLASELWKSPDFSYGMEYGYILALMDAFYICPEDL